MFTVVSTVYASESTEVTYDLTTKVADVSTAYGDVSLASTAVTEITLQNSYSNDEPSDDSTVFIEGTQKVEPGEEFTLNVILNNFTEGIYAGDIILNYDDSLFEFKSYEPIGDPDKFFYIKHDQPGIVRIIFATEGIAINSGRAPLFNLNFISKDTVAGELGSFTIAKSDFGIMPGSLVYSASGTGIDILVEESWNAGDVNNDGVINTGDLAICTYYYQVSEGDLNWSLAKSSDVNNDGIINIVDLSFIAQLVV
jgi:hypothetical protein